VRKFECEILAAVFFAARDATSAMSLFIPAMDTVSKGEERCTCCRNASARQRCPPSFDFEDASLVAHATAGVLSQKIPTFECCKCVGTMFSSTSHASRTPAISKSEMEIVPFLLLADTKFCCMSFGHNIRHTVG
jgi:hypothetical protein